MTNKPMHFSRITFLSAVCGGPLSVRFCATVIKTALTGFLERTAVGVALVMMLCPLLIDT